VVPLALALIGFWLTMQQDKRQQRIENQMAASDRAIEEQRAEQATPQTYLDQMGRLLLNCDPRNASENCDVRRMARARTLMVLGSVQTPKIRPSLWVGERLLRDTVGREGRPQWSSRSS
jgi:type II secretory pathway pseudopilin PulG